MKIILKRVLTVLVIIVLVVPLFVYQSMNVAATGDLADTDILSGSSVSEVSGELSGGGNENGGGAGDDDPVVVPDEDEPQSPSFNVEFGALSEDISFFGAEDNNEDAMDISLTWLPAASANRIVYKDGGRMLDLTPENNLPKTISFQVVFSLPSDPSDRVAAPNEIEIRVPMYIFKDRNGSFVVNTTDANSYGDHALKSGANHYQGFYSVQDRTTNEFLIRNWKEFSPSDQGIMDVSYTYIPSNIENEFSRTVANNNPITATATYRPAAGEAVTTVSNPLEVKVNTFVRQPANVAVNMISDAKYEKWNAAWTPAATAWPADWGGTATEREAWRTRPDIWPEDKGRFERHPDEYFYLVWRIRYQQTPTNCTQPYDLTFSYNLHGYGEVVGISSSGNASTLYSTYSTADPGVTGPFVGLNQQQRDNAVMEKFRVIPSSTDTATGRYWHRQILVKYPKWLIPPGSTVNFSGEVLLTGIDDNYGEINKLDKIIESAAVVGTGPVYSHVGEYWGTWNSATSPPDSTMASQPKYTHISRPPRASYTYNGLHFNYGGGIYGAAKSAIGNANAGSSATVFGALNLLEEGINSNLLRATSDTYSFRVDASAQGWSLTREKGTIAIPTDIVWYTENEGWDFEDIKAHAREIFIQNPGDPDPVITLVNGWTAVYSGWSTNTGIAGANRYYWEIFNNDGEGIESLGFIRLSTQAAISSRTSLQLTTDLLPIKNIRREGFSTYYKREYTTELIDSMMFLDSVRLKPDDYSITSTYLTYDEYVHFMNTDSGTVSAVAATDWQNWKPVQVQYKRVSMTGWQTAGNVLRNGSVYTYTPIFAGAPQLQNPAQAMSSANQLILPDDTYEIRYIHTNSRYQVYIYGYFKARINATPNVIGILKGKTTSTLYNVNTMAIIDDEGVVRNQVPHGTIYRSVNDTGGFSGNNPSVLGEPFKKNIMEHDHLQYGTNFTNYNPATIATTNPVYVNPATGVTGDTAVQHYYASMTLNKTPVSTGISKNNTGSILSGRNNSTPVDNDIKGEKYIYQSVQVFEQISYNPSIVPGASVEERVEELTKLGLFNQQKSGTFYDLLPLGVTFDELEVVTYYYDPLTTQTNADYMMHVDEAHAANRLKCDFDYYTVDNWQGSGRTMLIVHATAPLEANFQLYQAPAGTLYDPPARKMAIKNGLSSTLNNLPSLATTANLFGSDSTNAQFNNWRLTPNYRNFYPKYNSNGWSTSYPFRRVEQVIGYETVRSGFILNYRIITTYDNIFDRAASGNYAATNNVAYRTDNGKLSDARDRFAGGGTAAPTAAPWTYFRSLESAPGVPDDRSDNTVYSSVTANFSVPQFAVSSVNKKVKSQIDIDYVDKTTTIPGGLYSYQLRYQSTKAVGFNSRNLVLYDVLENEPDFVPGTDPPEPRDTWRGTLVDVDVALARAKGINPVVYYSTKPGLVLTSGSGNSTIKTTDADLTDGTIWTKWKWWEGNTAKIDLPPDFSKVTAIAIDLSNRISTAPAPFQSDGFDYVFRDADSVICFVNMRAPTADYEAIIDEQLKAVNRMAFSHSFFGPSGNPVLPAAGMSQQTEVNLRELGFDIKKSSIPPSGADALNPAPVNQGEVFTYTISLINEDTFPVTDVKFYDMIPDGLEIQKEDIKYYFGSNPATAVSIYSAGSLVKLENGTEPPSQKLAFVISQMNAMQTANIIIPVKAMAENTLFANQAVITEINKADYTKYDKKSNFTYHQIYPKIKLAGIKTIDGRNLVNREFEFIVTETDVTDNVNPVTPRGIIAAARNNNRVAREGDFVFPDIFFMETGIYTLKVQETLGSLAGITYDPKEYTVTVNVDYDNGLYIKEVSVDGIIVYDAAADDLSGVVWGIDFENKYTPPPAGLTLKTQTHSSIIGRKTMNRGLANGEFKFAVTDATPLSPTLGQVVATGTNQNNGYIDFGAITYTHADIGQTFKYIVSEIEPGALEPGYDKWITYDKDTYELSVTITTNPVTGQLIATPSVTGKTTVEEGFDNTYTGTINFKNHYTTPPVIYNLSGKKTLDGRNLRNEDFEFEITGVSTTSARGEVRMPAVTRVKNNAAGNLVFSGIEYWEEDIGQHVYTIKEVVPAVKDPSITYDERVFTVTVTVTKNAYSGALEAVSRVTKIDNTIILLNEPVEFKNTFTPPPIYMSGHPTFKMEAQKLFTGGRNLKPGEFSFRVTDITDLFNQKVYPLVTNDGTGKVILPNIEFTHAGTYDFKIEEVVPAPANRDPQVTYDYAVFSLRIVVVRDAVSGELRFSGSPVLTKTYTVNDNSVTVNAASMVFTNVFTPPPGSFMLTGGLKRLSERYQVAGEFEFIVTDITDPLPANHKTVATGINAHGGANDSEIAFGQIQVSKPGVYTYRVRETNKGAPGVAYDTKEYVFTVTVTVDPLTGDLVFGIPVVTNGPIVFNNTYTSPPVNVTLNGAKALAGGRDLTANEFSFIVKDSSTGTQIATGTNAADGSIVFTPIRISDTGTYTYKVSEVTPESILQDPNITYDPETYDVSLTVTKDPSTGALQPESPEITINGEPASLTFTNIYTPDPVRATLGGTKILSGGRPLAAGEFEFELTDVSSPNRVLTEPLLATNAFDGTFSFTPVQFSKTGTYTFEVAETAPGLSGRITGVTYSNLVYTVTIEVTQNPATGALIIGAPEYEMTGESSGTADSIVFTNKYTPAPVDLNLAGSKNLIGRYQEEGEFEFVVKNAGGAIVAYGGNTESGAIEFGPLTYTVADLGNTYTYTVSEVAGDPEVTGITYDPASFRVSVSVTQNADGTLKAAPTYTDGPIVFNNKYTPEPGTLALTAWKNLTGRNLVTDEFTFIVKDSAGTEIARGTNNSSGSVTFSPALHFTDEDVGSIFTYYISEEAGNTGLTRITYDSTIYTVTVSVTQDPVTGELITRPSLSGAQVEFNNTYTPPPGTFSISGTKTLVGRHLVDGEFDFTVTDVTDPASPVKVAAGTNVSGSVSSVSNTITFTPVTVTKPGVHTYTVTEDNQGAARIGYDDTAYTVTVDVTTNPVTGALVIGTPYISGGPVLFVNTFNPPPVEVVLAGSKELTGGRNLKAGEFDFIIEDGSKPAGERIVATGTNTAGGSILFSPITIPEAGTHFYTVSEVLGDTTTTGITYDSKDYLVSVTVTQDPETGLLTYGPPHYINGQVNFSNHFTPEPAESVLTGTKILKGREQKDEEFRFIVKDVTDPLPVNHKIVAAGMNKIGGLRSISELSECGLPNCTSAIVFDPIVHTKPGVYKYEVSEIDNKQDGIDNDYSVFRVSITVTMDPETGDLIAGEPVYSKGLINVDSIEFVNKVKKLVVPQVTVSVQLLGPKELGHAMFPFHILDNNGGADNGKIVSTGTHNVNGGNNGYVTFSSIPYTVEDIGKTFYYTVVPVNNSIDGVTYDSMTYPLMVKVFLDPVTNEIAIAPMFYSLSNPALVFDSVEFVHVFEQTDESPGDQEEDDPEDTEDPGGTQNTSNTWTPGGRDRNTPPNPNNQGNTLRASNGGYLEIGPDGAVVGRWVWDAASGSWVFKTAPLTGDNMAVNMYQVFLALSSVCIVLLLVLFRSKNNTRRERKKQRE